MSTAVAAVPAVSGRQADIRNTLDAREKITLAIAALESDRIAAVNDLVRQVAKDLATAAKADPDRLFETHRAWKSKDDRIGERLAALGDLLAKTGARIDEFRADPAAREELAAALRARIAALKESKGVHDRESGALQTLLKRLQDELDSLSAPPASKVSKGA